MTLRSVATTLGVVGLLMAFLVSEAFSIPRFTLLSGTRCSACHFSPNGGGIRNELGYMTMNETGALTLEEAGLGALASGSNELFGGVLSLGGDLRGQLVKIGRPPADERRFFPMQVALYGALEPTDGLTAYGGYNFSALKFSYPGQTEWNAALQYQPSITAPSIRVGYFQPSIGIRHDDHTVFVRKDAARSNTPLIPPDFSELGGELTYEGTNLVTINAGLYASHQLSEVIRNIDSSSLAWSSRVILWPQLLEEGINGMVGGSVYGADEWIMGNVFAGFGLADDATFLGEYMIAENGDRQLTRNYSAMTSFQLWPWLSLEARYEWAQTEVPPSGLFHASSFVLGAQFFPIPMLELRPEYRYFENDEYRQGQYTFQVHAFF